MISIAPKWKITLDFGFAGTVESTVMYISDKFASNVLRKLAEIEFERQPTKILVEFIK